MEGIRTDLRSPHRHADGSTPLPERAAAPAWSDTPQIATTNPAPADSLFPYRQDVAGRRTHHRGSAVKLYCVLAMHTGTSRNPASSNDATASPPLPGRRYRPRGNLPLRSRGSCPPAGSQGIQRLVGGFPGLDPADDGAGQSLGARPAVGPMGTPDHFHAQRREHHGLPRIPLRYRT